MTLPLGFQVTLASDVRTVGSDVLVGGSPLSVMRLQPLAAMHLRERTLTVTDAVSATVADRLLAGNLAMPVLEGRPPVDPALLTVVIPVRDRLEPLDRALTRLGEVACIVVDDASTDARAVASVARKHGVECLRLPENLGPAGARNAGLAAVRTPFVAFVDSDIQVSLDSLLRLTRHFADPRVALVGPKVVGRATSGQPAWFERYDECASSLTLGERPGSVRPGTTVGWLPSACLVGRTAQLEAGFADELRAGEDVDLVWRLIGAGWRVRYDPAVVADHDARSRLADWLGRKVLYGSSAAPLAQRHGGAVAPAVLTPAFAVAAAAVLARHPLGPALAGLAIARTTLRLAREVPSGSAGTAIAARLAGRAFWWSLRQESTLLLRHWWPLTAIGVLTSGSVRRALVSSLVIDLVVQAHESVGARRVPRLADVLARRLDDGAYGLGVWWGAVKHRSARALLPRISRTASRRR